ncbi:MAG: ABC transporter ATP-binding protein, partial [Gammaproteobacteria bacterium]|nr:ABC transporter ATP-binding protein [Gammaproteobacteria bacterium]
MNETQVEATAAPYDWRYLWAIARRHRRELVIANLVALGATLASIPLPLLMPLLVDEVLLAQPGMTVAVIDSVFPPEWRGPVLYILVLLGVSVVLRVLALSLNVLQGLQFTRVSKDIVYRLRRELLQRLRRISMAEYETLGSGSVASHFVTDLQTVDEFVGSTISRFVVASLSIAGAALILLWMHWQLAVLILLVNPLVVYFTVVLGKRVKELKRRENSAFEVFQQSLTETLDAIHQIRAANRERHYVRRMIDRAREVRDHATAFTWQSDAANRASFVIFLSGMDLFRAVSMLMVVFSGLTVGQMFAVFGYLWFMMGPVQEVLNIQYAYYGARAA